MRCGRRTTTRLLTCVHVALLLSQLVSFNDQVLDTLLWQHKKYVFNKVSYILKKREGGVRENEVKQVADGGVCTVTECCSMKNSKSDSWVLQSCVAGNQYLHDNSQYSVEYCTVYCRTEIYYINLEIAAVSLLLSSLDWQAYIKGKWSCLRCDTLRRCKGYKH